MALFEAVIILIFVGGGIAYLGDRIGSTVGKKRLSVMRLRPRDTARVFTVCAGALIALVTFFTLYLLDKGFQIALQHGAELIERNHSLSAQNRKLMNDEAQTQAQLNQAESGSQAARQELTTVDTQLRGAQSGIRSANSALKQLQQKLGLDQSRVADLARRAAVLVAENAQADDRLNRSLAQLTAHSEGTLVYRSEEEVDRCVIVSGEPLDETRDQITAFLSRLDQEAKARGAAGAQLAKIGINSVVMGESENIDALAQSIHDAHEGKVVVIARAWGNAYANGEVIVLLRPYADRLVIPAGSQLASISIPNGSAQNSANLLGDLQELLESASANARRAGMIPVANPQLKEFPVIDVSLANLYQVVDQIKATSGPAVVVVTAEKDTYAGDHPIALRFTVDGNEIRPV